MEALSILIGCKKLKAMHGFKAIIEVDSFLAILWGSSSSSYL